MTTQPNLFDIPTLPYGGKVPAAPTATSRQAARELAPKIGNWQRKVLICLYEHGSLSDEELEDRLDCVRTRTSRPRRRELELAGYVQDSGQRTQGIGGTPVILWQLTRSGVELAQAVSA